MAEQLLEHDQLADAVLRPVRGHHAFESCVEKLATSIRLGIYADGTTLPPERELAERIGVSRATLREAIAALREAGLVTTRRGRGGGEPFRPSVRGLCRSWIAARRQRRRDSRRAPRIDERRASRSWRVELSGFQDQCGPGQVAETLTVTSTLAVC